MKKRHIVANVEYGVGGYVLENVRFHAISMDQLIERIHEKTRKLAIMLEEADERDGDLRQFTPEFGNGYISLGGCEAEFGVDGIFSGCLIDLSIGDNELTHRMRGHRRVVDGAGLY